MAPKNWISYVDGPYDVASRLSSRWLTFRMRPVNTLIQIYYGFDFDYYKLAFKILTYLENFSQNYAIFDGKNSFFHVLIGM